MTVDVDVIERDRPLPPSRDPFFHPPRGFARYPAGTILRSRTVEIAFFGLVPQRVTAWQLLYRSQDLHGAPEVAITTVLLPEGAEPDSERPLLAFQTAMDAVTDRCAPSYALRRGALAPGSITQLEWLLVAGALRRGWAVSLADHEGPQGNFGVAREPGYRALDGVRAALRFAPLGLHADTRVAVWGYSGGGMASSWLVEMAPEYAPELNIVGAVLGAPVGDPRHVFLNLDGSLFSGFPAIVIAALRQVYPVMAEVVEREFTAEGHRLLERARSLGPIAVLPLLVGRRMDDYLHRPLAEILPDLEPMFDDLRLGHRTPECPVLVVQPVHDQVIDAAGIDGQVDRYRAGGAAVWYVRDRLSEHFSLLPLATPMSLDWLADRLAGKTLTEPTTKTVWSVALSPAHWRSMVEMATTAMRVTLGLPLRRPDTAVSDEVSGLAA
ncbi:lipase family protein [Nocardia seriolae]|uniref:Triacylglycerol lipase n=1 Tax=Nocardia seriolae TaxID=37332 RepID=A0ABC8ALS3_9NOCA|nr:lipase family protein [Nocardia seriolae]APA95110.1 Triacylglycerol lipase [Nocardia seriolae]OJF83244.1 lipase [Nocardia seriolae]PSK32633.1 lipase [Nocardia seriolae]QOW31993.1 lipase [Nocardia seriolae]QUN19600.1 lipase [Nocardia seriolae]